MSRKRTTGFLIAGVLTALFIIIPILRLFGVPSAYDLLTNLFGNNDPLVFMIMLLAIVFLVGGAYKISKK